MKGLIEKVETVMRDAAMSVPGMRTIPEAEYCDVMLEALELIRFGIAMRKEELQEDVIE